MGGSILIGTSGFVYQHWRNGVFYPDDVPQRVELEYYAERFRTVELNSPFYHLPQPGTWDGWRERTPGDFVFAVKASRYITHVKRLEDAAPSVARYFEGARRLGRKLGPVLFQLPPGLERDVERLGGLLAVLPEHRVVLEVRHASWLDDAVFDALRERGVARCVAVGGRLELTEAPDTAAFAYIRMHEGRGRYGNFTAAQLAEWASRIARLRAAGKDVYVYFNNDRKGCAVRNAARLKQLLGVER